MTFLAGSTALWIVIALAAVAAIALLVAEWRRTDVRRRSWRVGATLLAVVALAVWALRPGWNGGAARPHGETLAVLWTPASRTVPLPPGVEALHRFALPGANVPGDVGVTFLPDVATMRRRFPEIGRVLVLGDGLDPAELPALAGLRAEFDGGTTRPAASTGPAVLSLRCPRALPLGGELAVEGRVGGLAAGGIAALTLEGPDGTETAAVTAPADANGEAGFLLRAPSPNAAGRFEWRFRLKENAGENARVAADETLGVQVRAPTLPRVLILESSPRFDTAALRRWYEAAGGALRARARLGQDRFRFFAAETGAAPGGEFNALDAGLLAGFDLVLADARALATLPAPERAALRAAVADTGLGVLTLADDALLPPSAVATDRAWLFPWQLRPLELAAGAADNNAGAEHLARVRWPGLAQGADLPLPADPFEIVPAPGQAGVVRDDQGRVLAATVGFGRGTLALTLVRETGRWQRADEPTLFAGYWSALFARTSRPLDAPGRWTLTGGDDGPGFVDQPMEFVWTGAAGTAPPGPIRVADGSGVSVALAPMSDPGEPGRWRVTFWPRRAGWHRIGAGGATGDFYVHAAGNWSALAAQRRRAATARFAVRSADGASVPAAVSAEPRPVRAWWWFGAFLLGAGFLWVERRLARG